MREWRLAAQVAFTFIGTVVGAGFASGQEILQFFTRFGSYGYLGILIATILFAWAGIRIFMLGSQLRASSCRQMTAYLCGEQWANLIDSFMMVMLFGVTVAMLAGVGALFAENLRIPFHIGVLMTMLLAFITILRGMKGILFANTLIVPVMLCLMIFLFVHSLFVPFTVPHPMFKTSTTWGWVASAFSYAAFNMGLAVSVLVPLAAEINQPRVLKWGAVLGATGLGLMLLGAQYSMNTHLPDILVYEIPLAYVTSSYGAFFQWLFLFLLWGEIFTTLIANVYGLSSQLSSPRQEKQGALVTILILIAAFFVAQIGFSKIVHYLYPLFGYISFLLFLLLLWPRRWNHRPFDSRGRSRHG